MEDLSSDISENNIEKRFKVDNIMCVKRNREEDDMY